MFNHTLEFEITNSDGLARLLEAIQADYYKSIAKDWKNNHLVMDTEQLVACKIGDGIGFDDGSTVRAITRNGNFALLLKKNFQQPFKHVKCHINNKPLQSIAHLEIGATYALSPKSSTQPYNDISNIFKYLGDGLCVALRSDNLCDKITPNIFNKMNAYKLTKIDT